MKRSVNRSTRTYRAEEKRLELTKIKWSGVIKQLENKIKDQDAELEKRAKVDNTRTPFCAALGHLYEKRNMVDSAIKLIEPMRNIYLLEQGKSL